MQHLPKKRNPAGGTAGLAKSDLAINGPEDSDLRAGAQRRLALRVAAGAGLSLAVAAVLVVVALGEGGRA